MRVLVTGIDGFVGSHLAEYLLTLPGVEVHGSVLLPGNIPNILHIKPSLHLHQADILDRDRMLSLLRDIRAEKILHLAGQAFVPTSFSDPRATFEANIMGGVNILEAARKLRADKETGPSILIVSTGEVYGKVDRVPIREDFALAPNNPYAASKAGLDIIAQQYRSSFDLRVVVTRPFNHAGARQNPLFVCSDFGKQFAEIEAGKRTPELHVGNLSAQRDFTDVRDVVKAYWLLLEKDQTHPVFNVCSGQPLSIQNLITIFEDITGIRVKVIGEKERMRPYDVPVVRGSYERLRKATGWAPSIPIRRTLNDVFEYWRGAI